MEIKIEKIGDQWYALANKARETSVCQDRAWIALIAGPDPKWKIKREFINKTLDKDRDVWLWDITPLKVYGYGKVYAWNGQSNYSYTKYGGSCGYFQIDDNGNIEELSFKDVLKIVNTKPKQTHTNMSLDQQEYSI